MNTQLSFSRPPPHFVCPFTKTVLKEPILSLTTGISYERSAIQAWQALRGNECPVTGRNLGFLVANKALEAEIDDWKQQIKGFRRIQRGSPTTYFLTNSKDSPQSTASDREKAKRKNEDLRQHVATRNKIMFDMVEKMMQTFTDAGMSAYISRVMDEKDEHSAKTTPTSSLPALNALIEDATTSRYQYNVEYTSIFRRGPTMNHSNSS
ncbi:U-box domain containing protein [Nitzschia inconspicua]|uniref:U-box domain containing protein n=1 Tax=Nitzschia inconspicua TaxID=303405 RepID=A0A9K3PP44_9STRA|nr:U-box domain containing protein [Nitzschia inconspicua]